MNIAAHPKTMTPPPLHVALPGALAEGVRLMAARRGDHLSQVEAGAFDQNGRGDLHRSQRAEKKLVA